MGESRIFERLARTSLDEHAQIRLHLDRLEAALGRLTPDDVRPEAMRLLAVEIRSLVDRLVEHFETEENGGLYREIADAVPDAAPALRHLADQHARIREILEMARIHALRGESEDAGPLLEDLEGVLLVLREHERREEDLIRSALSA